MIKYDGMDKKKKKRSLEEIFASLKEAEREFDDKLEKYGMKNVKPPKKEEEEKIAEQVEDINPLETSNTESVEVKEPNNQDA